MAPNIPYRNNVAHLLTLIFSFKVAIINNLKGLLLVTYQSKKNKLANPKNCECNKFQNVVNVSS